MKNYLLAACFLCCSLLAYGQESLKELSALPKDEQGRYPFWRCASAEVEDILRQRNPEMGSEQDFENFLRQATQRRQSFAIATEQLMVIPVVVHVIHNGEALGNGSNISFEQIKSQIEVLNEDFRRLLGSRGFNDHPDGADVKIEFVLADYAPDGSSLAEKGVHRVNAPNELGVSGALDVGTIDDVVKPNTFWDPNRYLNMWTAELGGGLLGYAQFPEASGLPGMEGASSIAETDGVVMAYSSFGSSDKGQFNLDAPFDKGRTATHEVGHWLGLRHIWGDDPCGYDDFCADTPESDAPNYGCPQGHSSCGSVDMIENYMDYTDDACMNIFTQDQKDRMLTVMEFSPRRKELLNSDVYESGLKANFTTQSKLIYTGQTVEFSDASQGTPVSWQWEFEGGEPSTSTEQKPEVTYSTGGIYAAALTVTDAEENTSTIRKFSVIVVQQPQQVAQAVIESDKAGILRNQLIEFSAKTHESVIDYNWTFEGGEPSVSNESNPVVSYSQPGTYDVSLTVRNSLGEDTQLLEDYITVEYGPEIVVNPNSFRKTLQIEDTTAVVEELTLTNNGDQTLEYQIAILDALQQEPATVSISRQPLAKGEEAEFNKQAGHFRSGNDGGIVKYNWIDSESSNGPGYSWEDISSSGTQMSLSDDDYEAVNLPFVFNFYDQPKEVIYVSSNGYLSFSSASVSSYSSQAMPNAADPNDVIAPFWRDLNPSDGGTIYTQGFADKWIVQYDQVPGYDGAGVYTFQVILYKDGRIRYNYQTIDPNYPATNGIENADGTKGMVMGYTDNYAQDSLSVLIKAVTPFLSLNQLSGSVEVGSSVNLEVTFDASSGTGGLYNKEILVTTNDPVNGLVSVPVELELIGSPEVTLADSALYFSELYVGGKESYFVEVLNPGTDTLEVELSADNSAFSVYEAGSVVKIPANSSYAFFVTFEPDTPGSFESTLTFTTNVSGKESLTMTAYGNAYAAPVMEVTPASISETMMVGEQIQTQIYIDNTAGGNPLNYWLANIDLATDEWTIGAQINTLILTDSDTAAMLFIDNISPYVTDMGFDVINYSTSVPEQGTLDYFDVVLIMPTYFTGNESLLGDEVALYAENGGNVVLSSEYYYYSNSGLFGSSWGDLEAYDVLSSQQERNVTAALDPQTVVAHPVTQGLGSLSAERRSKQGQLQYNSQVLASWDDGSPLVALRYMELSGNDGKVLAITADAASAYQGGAVSGDFYQLWARALQWSGEQQLELSKYGPQSVAVGEIDTLNVTLNAPALGGTYEHVVYIESDDPQNSYAEVPVTLEVSGTPVFDVSEDVLTFDEVYISGTYTDGFFVGNFGNDVLEITSVTSATGNLIARPSSLTIPAGETMIMEVDFTPSATGAFADTLVFATNTSQGMHKLPVAGTVIPAPALGLSETAFNAALQVGDTSQLFSLTVDNFEGENELYTYFDVNYQQSQAFNAPQANRERHFGDFAGEPVYGSLKAKSSLQQKETKEAERLLAQYEDFPQSSTGMTWAEGKLYVVDFETQKLMAYDPQTESTRFAFDLPEEPYGIAWDGEYFWIGSVGNVYIYDMQGAEVGSISSPTQAPYNAMAWDGSNLLIAEAFFEGASVSVVNDTGAVVDTYYQSDYLFFDQIAYKNGNLLALDGEYGEIYQHEIKEDGSLEVISFYETPYTEEYSYSLTTDEMGYAYFAAWESPLYKLDVDNLQMPDWMVGDIPGVLNTTAIGESYEVNFNLTALSEMPVGAHQLDLWIESNDPQNEYVMIPVTVDVINTVPHVINTIPDQTLTLGEEIYRVDLKYLFGDVNAGDELDYLAEADNQKVLLEFDGSELIVTPVQGGVSQLSVYAEDQHGGRSESYTFGVSVTNPDNMAPQVSAEPEVDYLLVGEQLELNLDDYFTDGNEHQLMYNVSGIDEALASYHAYENKLSITALNSGELNVSVMANDQHGGIATLEFTLILNHAPTASTIEDRVMELQQDDFNMILSSYFNDPDNDAMSYSVSASQAGIVNTTISEGVLTLSPAEVGETMLTLTADDGKTGQVSTTMNVIIHLAPALKASVEDVEMYIDESITLNLSEHFEDPEGYPLMFGVSTYNEAVISAGISGSVLEINGLAEGTTALELTVIDHYGARLPVVFNVTVEQILGADLAHKETFTAYPNPLSGQELVVSFTAKETGKVKLTLYNMMGQRVQSVVWNKAAPKLEGNMNLSEIEEGLYLLEVMTENSRKVQQIIRK